MASTHDTAASASALPDGALILDGRFRLKKLLGEGGMGLVYLGEQVSLGRPVAVKVLREDLSQMAGMGERFRREALLLSSVEHAAVVRVIDFGMHGASACLVMEYVEGETLDTALREGPFAPERALPLLVQLCQGLSAIHDKGIVHRDLKPENVVLTRTAAGEQARLLDFGIARLAAPEAGANVTQMGMVLGTPEVLSPEQAMGQSLDARSDLYSLGVVAYRMLSGVLPFPGPSAQQFVSQHISQPPRPLLEARPELSAHEALCRLVMSCLEKSPERRPQTALGLAADLARLSVGLPEGAAPLLLTASISGLIKAPGTLPPGSGLEVWSDEVKRRDTRFRRRLVAGSLSLCILALGVTALVLWLAPARKARRLLAEGRGSQALQVIDDAGDEGKAWPMQMLKATALHQVNRHDEELELMKGVPDEQPLEAMALEALADDFGRKDTPALRKVLDGYPKATALPLLQAVATREPSRAGWGALRFIDLAYAGQGLPLVELYLRALDSSDCKVRAVAARRVGELRNPAALEPLRKLKELPRKKTGVFGNDDDCGQNAAAAALLKLEKELEP